MPKPNFSQLTRKELKAYIRQYPTYDEAIRELFVSRRHPDAKTVRHDIPKIELDKVFLGKSSNR